MKNDFFVSVKNFCWLPRDFGFLDFGTLGVVGLRAKKKNANHEGLLDRQTSQKSPKIAQSPLISEIVKMRTSDVSPILV
jgi:hypothetical protein